MDLYNKLMEVARWPQRWKDRFFELRHDYDKKTAYDITKNEMNTDAAYQRAAGNDVTRK